MRIIMNKKSKVILLPCNSYREELVYENLETGLELLGGLEIYCRQRRVGSC